MRFLADDRVFTKVALLVSALGAAGCFDVHDVDLGPLVIDDFDDGDFVSADPHFPLSWQCFAFNPDRKTGFTCDYDAGDNSPYSLYLEATIYDPPDGVQQFGRRGPGDVRDRARGFLAFS